MKLHNVCGNTYYINFPSIVGLYKFSDNSCLLIDSGPSPSYGMRTLKILEENGFKIYGIFNTHFHGDHTGGNNVIQEHSQCNIYASPLDKPLIENPIISPFTIFSAYPLNSLKNKMIMANSSQVTHAITAGTLNINDEEFTIIDLSGHTMGQIGIVTPDNVFFSGDAVISDRNLKKFNFLYTADLKSHINTLERIRHLEYPYVVLSHDGLINEQLNKFLDTNMNLIKNIIKIILKSLNKPLTREQIVHTVVEEMDLPINTSQYFLISASLSSYISYLANEKFIRTLIDDKQIKFVVS